MRASWPPIRGAVWFFGLKSFCPAFEEEFEEEKEESTS
jgi:hypothetical protein